MLGREALRQYREKQAQEAQEPPRPPSLMDQVPPDAPMPDAVLAVWNGEEWVTWERWLATAPIIREEGQQDARPAASADATCMAGECGGVKVWLVKDGERWEMYAGSRKAGGRRRDFATPYLDHAIRTAESWYGAPGVGWRAEKGRDAGAREAADLPPQDSTAEKGTGKRGDDDLDLGWLEPGR